MVVLVIPKNEEDPIKNEVARVATTFSHYNSMGAICCYGNQSSDPICLKTYGRQSPTPMLLHVKSDCNRPASLRDIQD